MGVLRFAALGILLSSALFGACTSSGTPAGADAADTAGREEQYRTPTSGDSDGEETTAEGELLEVQAVVRLGRLYMETGDVHPGESYLILLEDDNPSDRELEYEWQLDSGASSAADQVSPLPEDRAAAETGPGSAGPGMDALAEALGTVGSGLESALASLAGTPDDVPADPAVTVAFPGRQAPVEPLIQPANDALLPDTGKDEATTVTTTEPQLTWTPDRPGPVLIRVRALADGEVLTDFLEMEVVVREPEPLVELVTELPETLREDGDLYVKLDATGLPAFGKGLFVIEFDRTKLSFRDAELGGFFDDCADARIYFAQPDKKAGRVLLAIDSRSPQVEPAGDGRIAQLRFSARQDIRDPADCRLSIMMEAGSRYVLDASGDNVLPLPVKRPVWSSDMQHGDWQVTQE
ncbi:hypothetical protein KDL29_07105 [bacterium]|nr:hypothetical protein [bacterium]